VGGEKHKSGAKVQNFVGWGGGGNPGFVTRGDLEKVPKRKWRGNKTERGKNSAVRKRERTTE